jgi:hypothetical protein
LDSDKKKTIVGVLKLVLPLPYVNTFLLDQLLTKAQITHIERDLKKEGGGS